MPTKQEKKRAKALAKSMPNNYQGALQEYGSHKKSSWRKSTPDQIVTVPKFKKDQQQVLDIVNKYLSGGKLPQQLQGLNLPGNNRNSFEPIRNAALNNFTQQGIPSIAERFQSLGGRDFSPGALSSGPLKNQLWNAKNDLMLNLAALESEYNLKNQAQQSGNYFNLMDQGLQPQYDTNTIQGQNSALRNVALGGLQAGANYLTGGGFGAVTGALRGLSQPQQNSMPSGNIFDNARNNPNYQVASNDNYLKTQQSLNPSFNPLGVGNSITQGYMNNLAPQGGNINPNQFNPYDISNMTVRGFGNRKY